MNNNMNSNTRKLTLAGILLAITTICAYLAGVLPTNKLSLLAIASFVTGIVVLETGVLNCTIFCAAAIGLGFLVLAGKPIFIIYALFFVPYGLIRFLAHKLKNIILIYIVKLLYFNAILFGTMILVLNFFINPAVLKMLHNFAGSEQIFNIIFYVLANIAFIAFDFLFGAVMDYYSTRIAKAIHKTNGEYK